MSRESSAATSSSGPGSGPSQSPFARCLVNGDATQESGARRRRRRALGISFLVEAALLGVVVFVPLVTSVAQPHLTRVEYFPFAPRTPDRTRADNTRTQRPRQFGITRRGLTYVIRGMQPRRVPTPAEGPGDAMLGGEDPIGTSGGDAFAHMNLAPVVPAPLPPEETKKKAERRPLKLSEPVVQAQLISRIEPRYPPLAVQIHLQGTVILHAIISRDGTITSLVVVSGHPLLVGAALDAVKQWRYRPTLLDGEPVEVDTTITVLFQLQKSRERGIKKGPKNRCFGPGKSRSRPSRGGPRKLFSRAEETVKSCTAIEAGRRALEIFSAARK